MDRKIKHYPKDNRFNLQLENGEFAFISYSKTGNHLDLMHSEVPLPLRGQGIGRELVLKTFEQIEKEGFTATAYCRYIHAVSKRHPYWGSIIN